MAPRGRPKKVGLRRIDAAIDALVPLGFSKEVVRKTVSELLKVYDDDGGWVFIEEASYKLVIETILEAQEKEAGKEEGKNPDEARPSEVGEQVVEGGETSSLRDGIPHSPNSGNVDWKDISCMDHGWRLGLNGHCNPTAKTLDAGHGRSALPSVPPIQRRMPCYGWISESEDEEEDPPSVAPVDQSQEEPENTGCLRQQRKRRWDVKPCDMLN